MLQKRIVRYSLPTACKRTLTGFSPSLHRWPADRGNDREAARGGCDCPRGPRLHLCGQSAGLPRSKHRRGRHLRSSLPRRLASSSLCTSVEPSCDWVLIIGKGQMCSLCRAHFVAAGCSLCSLHPAYTSHAPCVCPFPGARRPAQGGAATQRAAGGVWRQPAREGSARSGPHLRPPAGHGKPGPACPCCVMRLKFPFCSWRQPAAGRRTCRVDSTLPQVS